MNVLPIYLSKRSPANDFELQRRGAGASDQDELTDTLHADVGLACQHAANSAGDRLPAADRLLGTLAFDLWRKGLSDLPNHYPNVIVVGQAVTGFIVSQLLRRGSHPGGEQTPSTRRRCPEETKVMDR